MRGLALDAEVEVEAEVESEASEAEKKGEGSMQRGSDYLPPSRPAERVPKRSPSWITTEANEGLGREFEQGMQMEEQG